MLALAPRLRGWLWCYRFVPLFALIAEALYRLTARHRGAVVSDGAAAVRRTAAPVPITHDTRNSSFAASALRRCLRSPRGGGRRPDSIGSQTASCPVRDISMRLTRSSVPRRLAVAAVAVLALERRLDDDGAVRGRKRRLVAADPARVADRWRRSSRTSVICRSNMAAACFCEFQWDILLVESLIVAAVLGRQPRVGIWLTRLPGVSFHVLVGRREAAVG